ncbi:[protein-PII] uridylyltransferase [Maricaulis sp.]|uniref:[protein-PII] uridylyltransferase n=1 Tax=Maricaulis sp. TaxID=1486257 RepID=UPI002B276FFE|nr:[protein-PII] uridylyltransferase [Maricaulis sp.]
MKMPALPASLDGLQLRARLASALAQQGWESPAARAAALAHVRTSIERFRRQAFGSLSGAGGGAIAAHLLSEGMSVCLHALFDSMAAADTAGSTGVALCAQGGFGAGELAPSSDIDLMLIKPEAASAATDTFLQQFLYALWDLKIDVGGGACRTMDETIALTQVDASERTALLSLRHLAGDEAATASLSQRFRDEVVAGDLPAFVEAKLKERDARIEKAGRSRYTVEPNLKSGKGGLRDLQLMRWLAQFLYGADAFERWVGSRLLSVEDVSKYILADDFLWTVRFHLHDLAGGKDERLTFDVQPEIAARMGFEDGETDSGVERFMRRYFRTAMDVGALTRLVCAKLEADAWKSKPRGLARFLPPGMEAAEDADVGEFIVRDGRLDFAHATQIREDPIRLMRFFHVAASRRLDLHPEAVARIGRTLHLIDDDFRRAPRAARAFFAVLLDSAAPMAVLRMMTEAGVLGRYLPEFGDIVARTQFNMYHRYTVDEHTLHALGVLREIEDGLHPLDHPLSTKLVPQIQNRRALHLAVLLHDTGKGAGDQCIEGAARAVTACERMGLGDTETELVSWLIASHLLMSDTAQRRDLSDPRTVADFAAAVGTVERLRLLTVLTVVDIRSVGPGVWNGWKGQLIRELYWATEQVLSSDGDNLQLARETLAEKAELARSHIRPRLERIDADFAAWWTAELNDAYWTTFSEEDRFRHAAFVRHARNAGRQTSAAVRVDRRRAATEVMIWSPDRDRVFADIVAAFAEVGADVVGATINTTASHQVFDIFYIQDAAGQPYGKHDAVQRQALVAYLRQVATGETTVRRRPAAPLKRRDAAFRVTPNVTISNEVAEHATVIEASGRDRPGLLADLADVLADERLALTSAQIDGYGERATDVFYVTSNGDKLVDDAVGQRVRNGLLAVFSENETEFDKTAAQRGFARARASVLR